MEGKYLRLDCRIKRYNRVNPASFIIDAGREPAAAAVFDRRSHESLDHRKGQGPRPLKTHAYNFSYIEDDQGKALVRERASNRQEAEAFAEAIMGAAKAISREAYLEELDRVIWPAYAKEEPGMRDWQSRSRVMMNRLVENPSDERPLMNMQFLADRPSQLRGCGREHPREPLQRPRPQGPGQGDPAPDGADGPRRPALAVPLRPDAAGRITAVRPS